MRAEWMLAQRPKGENWVTRNSSTEYRDSPFLRLQLQGKPEASRRAQTILRDMAVRRWDSANPRGSLPD